MKQIWENRNTRALFQLHVRTLFQNGLFEYDRAFDVWNTKFEILLVQLEKAFQSFEKVLDAQAKRDARAKQLAMKVGFTVLTIGLSAVGLGVVGELIRTAVTSEGANLVARCVEETIVELGRVAADKLIDGVSEKIHHNLSHYANAKAAKALKNQAHRLNDVEGELERLQDSLKDVIREMKLKYASVVNSRTTGIANDPNQLKAVFKRIVQIVSIRKNRRYQNDNSGVCSFNDLHDEINLWVARTRQRLDRELTRLFYCPHDQARNNRAATKKSLEKMLWAEWILVQAEGKTDFDRQRIIGHLSNIGGNDIYRSGNYRLTLPSGKGMSVLKNIGKDITNELIRLGVVEWRDQRYSSFRSQAERQRIDWEHLQQGKVFTGKSLRGQIGGDRAKGRLVLWAHEYLEGNPLKEALGVQDEALQNAAVLQQIQ